MIVPCRRREGRRGSFPFLALAGMLSLSLSGCGTVVYQHTVQLLVADPTHRLGPPPIEVSVFDRYMGTSSEWARKTMAPTSDASPYRAPFTTTSAATVFDPPRPRELSLAVAVPALEPRGYFILQLRPTDVPTRSSPSAFVSWGDFFPAGEAPTMTYRYKATSSAHGWSLEILLEIPPAATR